MEEAEGLRRPPSSQAYVSEFKFQSILADDLLDFYLEYFPELKQKGVDSIPGEQRGRWGSWPPRPPEVALRSRPRAQARPSWLSLNLDPRLTPWLGPGAWVGWGAESPRVSS